MNQKQKLAYQCLIIFLSNVVLGAGIGLLRMVKVGIDPFSGMTLGASYFLREQMHLAFMTCGVFQVCLNIVLILIVFFCNRHYIGIGTIINMFLLGFLADGSEAMGHWLFGYEFAVWQRAIMLFIGVVVIAMGVGVYSAVDLGMGPYDALPYIIQERTGGRVHVRYARMGCDILCVVAAVLLALPTKRVTTVAGIATIILAFCLGPLNYFFRVHLGENWLLGKCRVEN